MNTRTFRILAGALDNPVPDDKAAPAAPLSRATSPFSATIGGQNANVFFLGLAPGFVGLAQATIKMPSQPNGSCPLAITGKRRGKQWPAGHGCRYSLIQTTPASHRPDRSEEHTSEEHTSELQSLSH